MKDIFLSVIIPSYDEMANLQKGVLDKVVHFFDCKKYPYEIIVVDDGSHDGSDEFVEKFAKDSETVSLINVKKVLLIIKKEIDCVLSPCNYLVLFGRDNVYTNP